nr:putative ribonuclease H-like domain-containing protein [Tanacetum cinerariifolium]
DFKLEDDTNVLLRTPRQHNMYSIDLNNIVPHKDLTCLVAKASADESMLWHRRLGHLNFKTMNKLVRHKLVKGLPSKCFENNHTYVACLKGKQHKASCKTKLVNSVSKSLHTLHMDLFRPTSVSSLNHKWFCLVVTDDFSRFTWTFFLKTKDETSGILRKFITEIENLKDLKVKFIRCDNGGEFKNKEMNEFCTRKGIKKEFINARTPQQNGVVKRRNMTLIEAARTMLADAKLPVTFWADAVKHCLLCSKQGLGKFDAKGDEGTSSTNFLGTKDAASQDMKKDVSSLRYTALPNCGNFNPTATSKNPSADQMETLTVEYAIPIVSSHVLTDCLDDSPEPSSDTRLISKRVTSQDDTPSLDNILTLSKRHKSKEMEEQSFIATIHQKTTPDLLQFCLFSCFLSQEEPKKIFDALKDPSWVEAMQKELLQFKIQNVWILVDCPEGMDVKSAFLYGTIDEEVYVMQPSRFQDSEFPDRVYKTLFIRKHIGDFLLVHVYVDDIIFGSSNLLLCREFEALMQEKFQMNAMGELNFFLGLQVLQKKDGIFLSQDKYVGDILKKFGYSDVRPDIMFVVCAYARHQVTPKECHLHAVKRIFRYLKGHPKQGLWYPKESSFDLVAYSDSDYGGATQDRKSTTGGCQFMGRRLILWQCKNQTIVATSTTEAEYVAAASGCGQVLWIQNQLLDYG